MFAYNSYGVTLTEVTLDLLTGQHCIDRVDMLFDCGERYKYGHYTCIFMYLLFWSRKPSFVLHVHALRKTHFNLQLERKLHTGNRLGSRENFRTIFTYSIKWWIFKTEMHCRHFVAIDSVCQPILTNKHSSILILHNKFRLQIYH